MKFRGKNQELLKIRNNQENQEVLDRLCHAVRSIDLFARDFFCLVTIATVLTPNKW